VAELKACGETTSLEAVVAVGRVEARSEAAGMEKIVKSDLRCFFLMQ
jgi:hypothetical protein